MVDLEKREMGGPQNRCCGFGLVINKRYQVSQSILVSPETYRLTWDPLQGKGYGSEAMEWVLRRAFVGYNMHRVEGKRMTAPPKLPALNSLTMCSCLPPAPFRWSL